MAGYCSDQIMKVLAEEKGLCAQHILENSTNLHYFVALGTVKDIFVSRKSGKSDMGTYYTSSNKQMLKKKKLKSFHMKTC